MESVGVLKLVRKIHRSGVIVSSAYAATIAPEIHLARSDASTTECAVAWAFIGGLRSSVLSPKPKSRPRRLARERPFGAWLRLARSSLLHLVQHLHVDVGRTEHGEEQDDRERRRPAGLPFLECRTLEGDRDRLGEGAGTAVGEEVHHVEHLEVLDRAEQDG